MSQQASPARQRQPLRIKRRPSGETEKMIGEIYEALHNVYDPELGVNIVDLGLVYNVDLREDGFVTITMTLTTPGCPMHESIGEGVGAALQPIAGVTGGTIQLVWEPRWEPVDDDRCGARRAWLLVLIAGFWAGDWDWRSLYAWRQDADDVRGGQDESRAKGRRRKLDRDDPAEQRDQRRRAAARR